MSKIIIVCTCPVTKGARYVSDIKPGLLQTGAKGDWGYSQKVDSASGLTIHQADKCMKDLKQIGRIPVMLSA